MSKKSVNPLFFGAFLCFYSIFSQAFGSGNLSLGDGVRYFLSGNGTLLSMGRDEFAQLGRGGNLNNPIPVEVSGNVTYVSAGVSHALLITDSGNVYSWGLNSYGQSHNLTGNVVIESGVAAASKVYGSGFVSTVLTQSNELFAKGRNHLGQLGLGDQVDRSQWQKITLPSANLHDGDGGLEHGLLLIDNNIYGYGSNGFGQLGPASSGNFISSPVLIDNAGNWIQVSAGGFHSLALNSMGQVYAWGKNVDGQLGLGSTTPQESTLSMISGFSQVIAVSAGRDHSLFLVDDGMERSLWAVGSNKFGQIGQVGMEFSSTPVRVGMHADVKEIHAGPYASIFLNDNGEVYFFGKDEAGGVNDTPIHWHTDDASAASPTASLVLDESVIFLQENSGSNTFNLQLGIAPSSNVNISVVSSNTSQITVAPANLVFTPLNWNVNQSVTVLGVNDSEFGDDEAEVILSVIDATSDDLYDPLDDEVVVAVCLNDDVETNLVGYWKLNEASISSVSSDNSTSGNDAPYNGGMSNDDIIGGVDGFGLEFDGIDDYLSPTNPLDGVQQGTIAMWARWDMQTQKSDNEIYGALTGVRSAHQQIIGLDGDDPDTAKITWRPYAWNVEAASSNISPGLNVWHHIAVSYENGSHKLYVDGELEGTGSLTGTIPTNASFKFEIGAWEGFSSFRGRMDEIKLYDRVLSQGEVRSLAIGFNSDVENVTLAKAGNVQQAFVQLTARPHGNVVIDVASSYSGNVTVSPSSLVFDETNYQVGQSISITRVAGDNGTHELVALSVNAMLSEDRFDGVGAQQIRTFLTHEPSPSHLVARYELNEQSTGGSVIDLGGVHNLTYEGSMVDADIVDGVRSGNALEFDGVDDSLTSSFNPILGHQQGTFSFWAYFEAQPMQNNHNFGSLISVRSNHHRQLNLDGGDPSTAKLEWNPYDWNIPALTSASSPGHRVWRHIAVTFNDGDHKIYIDGQLDGTGSTTGHFSYNASYALDIAKWNGFSNFRGRLDEIRIYNKALNVAEVRKLSLGFSLSHGQTRLTAVGSSNLLDVRLNAKPSSNVVINVTSLNAGDQTVSPNTLVFTPDDWSVTQSVNITRVLAVPNQGVGQVELAVDPSQSADRFDDLRPQIFRVDLTDQPAPERLVAHWRFDDGAIGTAIDEGEFAHDLTHEGSMTSSDIVAGAYGGNALSFDGVDDALTVAPNPLSGIQEGTIGVWVWYDAQPVQNNDKYGSLMSVRSNHDRQLTLTGGDPSTAKIEWNPYAWNAPAVTSVTSPGYRVWRHVTVTYKDGEHKIYIDGQLDATGSTSGIFPYNATYALDIGKWHGFTNFKGKMDDFRLYDKVLSADEISELALGFSLSAGDLVFAESGNVQNIDVVLNAQPNSDVVIDVFTSDATEVSLSSIALTFTSLNWNTPQSVSLTRLKANPGVDKVYIDFAVNAGSSEDRFDSLLQQTVNAHLTSEPAPQHLIAHWSLDDASIGTALDVGPNGFDATHEGSIGSANIIDGVRSGNALVLDGIDDALSVTNNPIVGLQEGTIGMWAWFDEARRVSNVNYGSLISVRSQHTRQLNLDGADPAQAKLVWNPYVYNVPAVTSTTSPGHRVWRHIAVTYKDGEHKLYIDGVLDGTGSTTGIFPYNNTYPLDIGKWHGFANFGGKLDDVRLYNKVLSAGEVQDLALGFSLDHGDAVLVGSGNTENLAIRLNTMPSSNVVLTLMSGNSSEATISPSTLVFTPANWNSQQNATITRVSAGANVEVVPMTVAVDPANSDDVWDGLLAQEFNVYLENVVAPSYLLAEWDYDEMSLAGVASDTSENDYDGTYEGSMSNIVTGISGNALEFDGIDDGVSQTNPLLYAQEGTISMFIKASGNQANYSATVYGTFASVRSNHNYMLSLDGEDPTTSKIQWSPYSWNAPVVTSTTSPGLNTWTHVAVTFKSGEHKLYINGVLEATDATTGDFTGNPIYNFDIGKWDTFVSFKGHIDQVKVFSRILTAAEIATLNSNP